MGYAGAPVRVLLVGQFLVGGTGRVVVSRVGDSSGCDVPVRLFRS